MWLIRLKWLLAAVSTTAFLPASLALANTQASRSHDPCPALCGTAVNNSNNWTTYHDTHFLSQCQHPMLLDFAVFTAVDDPSKTKTIRACAAHALDPAAAAKIMAKNESSGIEAPLRITSKSTANQSVNAVPLVDAVGRMQAFYGVEHSYQPSLFASYGEMTFAVHVGPGVNANAMAIAILQELKDYLQKNGATETFLLQICHQGYTVGAILDTGVPRLATAQKALQHWVNGTCVAELENKIPSKAIPLIGAATTTTAVGDNYNGTAKGFSSAKNESTLSQLARRDGCTTVTVAAGDSCGSLATKCGISASEFTKYNPSSTLCSTLQPQQKVCCSSGGLPVPQQSADGSCATYNVQAGNTCDVIAASNGITTGQIESFNKNTWGWTGCSDIQSGAIICLSTGTPPMPSPVANAVCGPQVPGTVKPTNGTKLADLNPCPLNSCCDAWGQCGITTDYCTDTGNGTPGTAAAGTNGCISNCGTDIANNGSAPTTFRRIAYFEAFNVDRPCLNMGVNQIDTSKYTHVHFAFGNVTTNFSVDIETYRFEFDQFLDLKQVKRVISLGGWAFSTDPSTYKIFREAVTSTNRDIFASNVANFVNTWGLDGVDFDWEYPGEPDILGIQSGSDENGNDYSLFLAALRKKLPNKSISVAAPASYWYLKGFPVANMDSSVDYWVYMTYDLHGQWDFGETWADPGCSAGNCLRSHVNLTETLDALAMITKAGVASNKVVVGLSNYGRSFQMTTPGCTGPMCTYTGKASGATPGRCTGTAGLLADAEIYEIIDKDSTAQHWLDQDSNSNILVYDSVQWVAYMDSSIRDSRTSLYKGENMGGVVEWAIDLEKFETTPTPTSLPTSTAPAVSMSASPTAGVDGAMNPYLYACTEQQRDMVLQAWEEADMLAQGHYEWWPGGKWQDAMTLYMGTNSKNDYSWLTGKGQLMKNIEREFLVHQGWWTQPPASTYGYFYCDETKIPGADKGDFKPKCGKNTAAYTWDDLGTFWSAHYVVFCPAFFSSRMTSLSEKVQVANGDPEMQRTMDYWRPVRARTMYHETYHWKDTVSKPRCRDYAYQAPDVVQLAVDDQTTAAINAESYAQAALAIYLQQVFHLSSPPTPAGYGSTSGSSVTIAGTEILETYLDAPPSWWDAPVANTSKTFTPDMTDITMMSGVGSLTDGGPFPSCVDGLYEDMEQCMQFCSGDSSSCNQSSTNSTIVCGGCVKQPSTPVCKQGSYSGWDECSAYCSGGSCFENAGQSGIQCEECP